MPKTPAPTEVGDLIVISGHRVGDHARVGEIRAVLGGPGHKRYRVAWEDGSETIFFPGSDATIRHQEHER